MFPGWEFQLYPRLGPTSSAAQEERTSVDSPRRGAHCVSVPIEAWHRNRQGMRPWAFLPARARLLQRPGWPPQHVMDAVYKGKPLARLCPKSFVEYLYMPPRHTWRQTAGNGLRCYHRQPQSLIEPASAMPPHESGQLSRTQSARYESSSCHALRKM